MTSRSSFGALVLVLLVSCSGNDAAPAPPRSFATATVTKCGSEDQSPPARPEFGTGTVLLKGDDGSHLLHVEIAQSDEQHQFGLMFKKTLANDAGMVFLFFENNNGGFYMRNTYLPLSIAYFDVNGKILNIVDMDPCEEDSTLYDPGVPYRGALEVNQGAFDTWGVSEGDVIHVVPTDPGM